MAWNAAGPPDGSNEVPDGLEFDQFRILSSRLLAGARSASEWVRFLEAIGEHDAATPFRQAARELGQILERRASSMSRRLGG